VCALHQTAQRPTKRGVVRIGRQIFDWDYDGTAGARTGVDVDQAAGQLVGTQYEPGGGCYGGKLG
jgi:hypothetical protein